MHLNEQNKPTETKIYQLNLEFNIKARDSSSAWAMVMAFGMESPDCNG